MNNPHLSGVCVPMCIRLKTNVYENVERYLRDKRELCLPAHADQRFRPQISSPVPPLARRPGEGGLAIGKSILSVLAQETLAPLHCLKSRPLSVGSFRAGPVPSLPWPPSSEV